MRSIGDGLSDITIQSASGTTVQLGAYTGNPLLVVGVRYYGCLPCLDFLGSVRDVYDEILRAGADVVAIGTGAHYQARHLMETGTPFPCLIDPDTRVYGALGARRLRPRSILDGRNYRNYWRALVRRRAHQGRMTGDSWQLPFVAVLNADGRLIHVYLGEAIGDYPPLGVVLGWLGLAEDSACRSPTS